MASSFSFVWHEPNQFKHVHLADDDPALPPETLKERLRARARRQQKAEEKAAALAAGVPLQVPKRGRRLSADGPKPNTLQKRKRKAEGAAALALMDAALPHFALADMVAVGAAGACTSAGPVLDDQHVAAELVATAAQVATERAVAAAALAAIAQAAPERAERAEAERAEVEQAAAEKAAAEKAAAEAAAAAKYAWDA